VWNSWASFLDIFKSHPALFRLAGPGTALVSTPKEPGGKPSPSEPSLQPNIGAGVSLRDALSYPHRCRLVAKTLQHVNMTGCQVVPQLSSPEMSDSLGRNVLSWTMQARYGPALGQRYRTV
jgi:hypothetical protein